MTTAKEIDKAVSRWDSRVWDEDHPDYDEDAERESVWDILYYQDRWVWNPRTKTGEFVTTDEFDVPGLGVLKVVDRFEDFDEVRQMNVVVEFDGKTYLKCGWIDSWGGGGGFGDGILTEVVGKEVVKKEWNVVND